ncbi:MAG: ATP-binding cassette domain-containing protein [Candidatus Wallbacteria bacterium]|nr:ATP-binding cassette domain-containing protein [Candidatus Wallbacteria bacterium]
MYFPVLGGVFRHVVATVKAVDGVSFSVNQGETLGLVGESGCGKTTVGRTIIRLNQPTDGSILFHDPDKGEVELAHLSRAELRPYRASIQMIFQDPYSSLNPRLTVGNIIEEPMQVHPQKINFKSSLDKVTWLLEKVGLSPEHAFRYPHEFSGGQRQRIGIARALSTNPSLIIADEPVSALDVSVQAQVINLMQDLQEEFGLSYIFIAHDLSVVKHISHRIAVMYLGNIVEIGPAEDVYNRPKHPYSQALLAAVPIPDPRKKNREKPVLGGDVPSPLAKPSGCGFRTRCPACQPECAETIPALKEISPEHWTACHYI